MNVLSNNEDEGTVCVELAGVRIASGWTPGRVWIFSREGDGAEMDEAELGDLLEEIARRAI
jgi:hypothetical protein